MHPPIQSAAKEIKKRAVKAGLGASHGVCYICNKHIKTSQQEVGAMQFT